MGSRPQTSQDGIVSEGALDILLPDFLLLDVCEHEEEFLVNSVFDYHISHPAYITLRDLRKPPSHS